MGYERIYPPDYLDKSEPDCPECGEHMFYVGERTEYDKGDWVKCKVYSCSICRRLYREK